MYVLEKFENITCSMFIVHSSVSADETNISHLVKLNNNNNIFFDAFRGERGIYCYLPTTELDYLLHHWIRLNGYENKKEKKL